MEKCTHFSIFNFDFFSPSQISLTPESSRRLLFRFISFRMVLEERTVARTEQLFSVSSQLFSLNTKTALFIIQNIFNTHQTNNISDHTSQTCITKIAPQELIICFSFIRQEELTKLITALKPSIFVLDPIPLKQGFSKFTFKGLNLNYHQRQKVRNNCYYKTCFYKHAYYFI